MLVLGQFLVVYVQVAAVMMNIISNLGDVNVSVTVDSNRENNTSERYTLSYMLTIVTVATNGHFISIYIYIYIYIRYGMLRFARKANDKKEHARTHAHTHARTHARTLAFTHARTHARTQLL